MMCDGTMVATRPEDAGTGRPARRGARCPVLVCQSYGEVYLDAAVARQLYVLFGRLLDGPVDHVVGRYEPSAALRGNEGAVGAESWDCGGVDRSPLGARVRNGRFCSLRAEPGRPRATCAHRG